MLFELQAGVAYGKFYEFVFERDSYEELTTIGFTCNYAAKLQNLASINSIAVSEDVYNAMDPVERMSFIRRTSPTIYKYEQSVYYEARIKQLKTRVNFNNERKDAIRSYANKRNLTDMQLPSVKKSLALEDLSTVIGRTIEGIPVFADVRDFTSQFNSDDSNLNEMAEKTRLLLEKMYATTVNHHGVHVQFQGDREFALYHNVENDKCFKDAVLGGMRMIDVVKPYSVHIGVGESFGKMYAVRIGAREEKDKLIIGRTVNNADQLEDEKAAADQLVISSEVYEGLKEQDLELAKQFRLVESGVYVTNQGFKAYTDQLKYAKQDKETKKHGYNGAWGNIK